MFVCQRLTLAAYMVWVAWDRLLGRARALDRDRDRDRSELGLDGGRLVFDGAVAAEAIEVEVDHRR